MASLRKLGLSVRCMSPNAQVASSPGHVRPHAPSNCSRSDRGRTFTKNAELNRDAKPLDPSATRSPNSSNSDRSTLRRQDQQPQSLKTVALNQITKLKNMTPDIAAFAKTVAVLNSELPHYVPSYQKLWPNFMRLRVFSAAPQVQNRVAENERETPRVSSRTPHNFIEETKQRLSQTENVEQRKTLRVTNRSNAINRETNDFSTAMLETNTSVQTYYSVSATESATNPVVPRTKSTDSDSLPATTTTKKVWSTPAKDDAAKWNISTYIPSLTNQKTPAAEKKEPVRKREMVAIRSIERRTREMVVSLQMATTTASKLMRLEEFCSHITKYPNSRNQAIQSKVMPCVLRLSQFKDNAIQQQAMVALSLLGYVKPPKGRGVRVLCLDGGGTRGLVAVELMKQLERVCQRPIHDMFDYICGVSTGSLIAIMVGAFRVPLDEVEQIYREFSKEMFERSRLMGASKLFMSHAYYDTQLWEAILKQNFNETTFVDSMKDPLCPKLALVSALTNLEKIQCHVFRNYNMLPSVQSHYMGSCSFKLWEAIRASSAAPGYYEEFKLGNMVHQDGGVLTNNPTAIAIHECRLLWPQEALQCVVSLGTGRYEPTSMPQSPVYTSLKTKVEKFVQSATDTEAVHTVLHDLLPPSVYFRFNPYLSEDFNLDEVRPDKWDQMLADTQMYCRKNEGKLDDVVTQLQLPRHLHQRFSDKVVEKCSMIG